MLNKAQVCMDAGIIGAAFDAGATVELICDGFHCAGRRVSSGENVFFSFVFNNPWISAFV